ncbi:MAG TPA: sulfatase, partial [Planctomycetota bacterium]|nr:sulfatase [Planctomycetota bacterium]
MSAGRIAVFVLLAGGVAALVISRMDAPPEPLVVLISIDTTRPDRLGPYGGLPGTSPNIDALAKDSVVFDQVLATSPWTLPSHMTMLTGLDPVAHGVRRNGDVLSGRVTTLPEALKKAGYRTGAFTGGGFVGAQFGFGAGFEVYRETNEPDGGPSGFARILPEALEWVNRARHEKSFVFLHTFDVHAPYDSCDPDTLQEFRTRPVTDGPNDYLLYKLSFLYQLNRMKVTNYTRFGELFNDYDAGVHMADDGVGRLIADLKESGRYDDALIIVTSDHGESFADHGLHIGHGIGLTDDELHVPLIIHFPKHEFAGRRIGTLVDLTDLAPTVLDVLHLPAPPEMKGESRCSTSSTVGARSVRSTSVPMRL